MKLRQLFGSAAALFVFLGTVHSEPQNVVVGDLTFERPADWVWEPPTGKSPALFRFVIPNDGGEIRFYFPGRSPDEARHWKRFVAKADARTFCLEEKKIGKRTITYVTFQGTLTMPGEKQLNNHRFVGVVIPISEGKFMHIRFTGPVNSLKQSTATLKKMVETAVAEREAEISNQ